MKQYYYDEHKLHIYNEQHCMIESGWNKNYMVIKPKLLPIDNPLHNIIIDDIVLANYCVKEAINKISLSMKIHYVRMVILKKCQSITIYLSPGYIEIEKNNPFATSGRISYQLQYEQYNFDRLDNLLDEITN